MASEGDRRKEARREFWQGVVAGVWIVGQDLKAEAVARAPVGRARGPRYRGARGLASRRRVSRVARRKDQNDARTGALRESAFGTLTGSYTLTGPTPSGAGGGDLTPSMFGESLAGMRELTTPVSPTATSPTAAEPPKDGQAIWYEISFHTVYAAAQHQGYAVQHLKGGKVRLWRAKRYSTPGTGKFYLSDPLYLKARRYTQLVGMAGRARMGALGSSGGAGPVAL